MFTFVTVHGVPLFVKLSMMPKSAGLAKLSEDRAKFSIRNCGTFCLNVWPNVLRDESHLYMYFPFSVSPPLSTQAILFYSFEFFIR